MASLQNPPQALELSAREASQAQQELEEARQKLQRTKTQLQAMTDRHSETLGRLETTKARPHDAVASTRAHIDSFV